MRTDRLSIGLALVAGPAVLTLELVRRAGMLDQPLLWVDDVIGAALVVGAALLALRDRRQLGLLALAWAFVAGQLLMSTLGQLASQGPDPSGQPALLVVAEGAAARRRREPCLNYLAGRAARLNQSSRARRLHSGAWNQVIAAHRIRPPTRAIAPGIA